ncbi:hypothetical protein [Streptomyces tendae]|uniref:hypothetical protein n=1 Tax=Streptomyces tendae TaxID=1932 RepID=UPI00364F95FD
MTDGNLGLVVTGDRNRIRIDGDVVVNARTRARRSSYRHEILDIATPDFLGRKAELAAMAAFATGADISAPRYWRWSGPAWSGKSALMAHFALHHPDDVDVLSFFVMARVPGRSDRRAFLTVLQEQLSEYLADGELDCSGPGTFHDALGRAADRAASAGRYLVLIVDGMDEDSGIPSASSGHSIAALLPRCPPTGLGILVAGRPHPPVPGDVPPGHPLRDPRIEHRLDASPAAQAVRADAERSLDLLITSPGTAHDLVALTAAAGGGLSAQDYAQLTGDSARRTELVLGGSTGRVFHGALSPLDPSGRVLYHFAHQELLVGARALLRPAELDAARERVHRFVEEFRRAGWPESTAEFALVGYPAMLRDSGDLDRLTELALDHERQERLWEFTGADNAALAESLDALDRHLLSQDPNLRTCTELALQRDAIRARAASVPPGVVSMWARLGQVRKAAQQASLSHAQRPGDLFGLVLGECRSAESVQHVLDVVFALTGRAQRDEALCHCAVTLAARGHGDRAAELCQSVEDDEMRVTALACSCLEVSKAARPQGVAELAELAASTILSAPEVVTGRDLPRVARALVAVGRHPSARVLVSSCAVGDDRSAALVAMCEELARRGDCAQALSEARSISHPEGRDEALRRVARVVAGTVDWKEALSATAAISSPAVRSAARAEAAVVLADGGHTEEAVEATGAALEEARELPAAADVGAVLSAVVQFRMSGGLLEEAGGWARRIPDFDHRVVSLDRVAVAWAEAGQAEEASRTAREAVELAMSQHPQHHVDCFVLPDMALLLTKVGLVDEALSVARRIFRYGYQVRAIANVVRELCDRGDYERALRVARSIDDRTWRGVALAMAAYSLAGADVEHSPIELAREATGLARTRTDRMLTYKLLDAVEDLALSGHREEALDAVAAFPDAAQRDQALLRAVRGAARSGKVREATELARTMPDSPNRDNAVQCVAEAWAARGRPSEALQLAQSLQATALRAETLAQVAAHLASNDEIEAAERAVEHAADTIAGITDLPDQHVFGLVTASMVLLQHRPSAFLQVARRVLPPDHRGGALARGVDHLLGKGDVQRALEVAHSIDDPWNRCHSLAEVAVALIKDGAYEKAEPLVRSVEAAGHPGTLSDLVEALLDAGRTERARAVSEASGDGSVRCQLAARRVGRIASEGRFEDALSAARRIEREPWRGNALASTASSLIKVGRTGEAGVLLDSLTDLSVAGSSVAGTVRRLASELARAGLAGELVPLADMVADSEVLEFIVESLAHHGHLEEASVAATTINDEERRKTALSKLSLATTDKGQLLDILRRFPDQNLREAALGHIAQQAAMLRDFAHAGSAAEAIVGEPARTGALSAVVESLIKAGRLEDAESLAREISSPSRRDDLLAAVAREVGKGSVEGALEHARGLQKPWQRSQALVGVVERLVAEGELERAVELARTLEDDEDRGSALLRVARAHGLACAPGRALVGEALATAPVSKLVQAMQESVPEVLAEVAPFVRPESGTSG